MFLINNLFSKYIHIFSSSSISFNNVLEIVLISTIIFVLIKWASKTKIKGFIEISLCFLLFYMIASFLQWTTLIWIFNHLMSIAIISAVILFQPELRNGLDAISRHLPVFSLVKSSNGKNETLITEVTNACFEMSKAKTGALIALEGNISMGRFCSTGIPIHGDVSRQLLINIFENNTPLHDGAVIIRNEKIDSATCYFPLTENPNIDKNLGTRHRAGIGITEITDCICIIVSEETGDISIAKHSTLYPIQSPEEMIDWLLENTGQSNNTERKAIWFA